MTSPTLAILCAFAVLPVLAVEAEYKRILVTPRDGFVEVRLPLTDVTGPARVKQRADDGFGVPIAPSRTNLDESCYIEWQISYDTTVAEHPSIVPDVRFQRDGRMKFGCELTKMLAGALDQRVLTRGELKALRGELDALSAVDLKSSERIALEPDTRRSAALPSEFERFTQRVPQFVASTLAGSVEIQFKPKQRAVGYQPMCMCACLPNRGANPMAHRARQAVPRSRKRSSIVSGANSARSCSPSCERSESRRRRTMRISERSSTRSSRRRPARERERPNRLSKPQHASSLADLRVRLLTPRARQPGFSANGAREHSLGRQP